MTVAQICSSSRAIFVTCLAIGSVNSLAVAQTSGGQGRKASPITALEQAALSAPVFIENMGQFDPKVKFQVKIGSQAVWLTNQGIVFDVTRPAAEEKVVTADPKTVDSANSQDPLQRFALKRTRPESRIVDRLVFSEDFEGASCCSKVEGKNPRPDVYNYLEGRDSKEWRTNVRGYAEVVYRDLWPGIDLRVYANGPDLEQEFILQPGADLTSIRMAYRGIDKVGISPDGSLEIGTAFGTLRETKPQLYQQIAGKRIAVDGRFKLAKGNAYTFEIGAHEAELSLVIDPTLLYSTFLGGSAGNNFYTSDQEYATGIAVDGSGSAFVTGFTASTDFPTTVGAYQTTWISTGLDDIFVTKISPTGSSLVYSTYLRGASYATAIAVDPHGNAYVTGWNASNVFGFPTTPSAYSQSCGSSGFLTVLNPTGSGLVYSTCFGSGEMLSAIAIDSNGRAYVAGGASNGAPTTPNAYQPSFPGGASAYLAIFDTTAAGSASLVYATFLGPSNGNQNAAANGVAIDSFGKVYLTGSASNGFPVTPGAFQTTHSSVSSDAFVAKLDPTVSGHSALIYSTFLGGAPYPNSPFGSSGSAIAVDASGSAYVAGITASPYFPSTSGAFQIACPLGFWGNPFVTKLNPGGSQLVYSTCIAGNFYANNNSVGGIMLDPQGNAYIAGGFRAQALSTFPVTPDAFQNSFTKASGDYSEAFLTKLNPAGSGLLYSSYLGGNGDDVATSLAIDQVGDAYLAGHTSSVNFPVTLGALQPSVDGTGDAFVAKFPLSALQALSIISVGPSAGGNAGSTSAHIQGGGFHSGAVVQLIGDTTVLGSGAVVGSQGRTIDVTFALSGVPAGLYSLKVVNPDGASATLSNAFTVQQGGGPQLSVSIVSENQIAADHPVAFMVQVNNAGNTDAVGAVISLYGIPADAILKPNFGIASVPTPIEQTPVDFTGVPFASVIGQQQMVHLLLPPISPGTSVSLPFTLAITSIPPLTPLLPLPPPFNGGGPPNITGLPTINITALATLIMDWCSSCLPPALDLLPPPFDAAVDIAECVKSFVCFYLTTAQAYGTRNPIPMEEFFAETLLNCCKVVADAVNAKKAVQVALTVIQKILTCVPNVEGSSTTQIYVNSHDPNDKEGSRGVGVPQWVTGSNVLPYGIYFLNEPNATAAAQRVILTDTLDPSLDFSTLTLNGIVIGGNNFPLPQTFAPALGQDQSSVVVDFRPAQNLLVNASVSLDPQSRTMSWRFTAVDPITGLAPNDLHVGVLPPGVEGSVFYSIKPMPAVTTGTKVLNQATIVFDSNPAISTPTWLNTIDKSTPTSHVAPLPSMEPPTGFTVSWSGTDQDSGVQDFTVFASDNGGPFAAWLTNTTSMSATFNGVLGHTYDFYSIARDLVGNVENAKSIAEATTTISAVPSIQCTGCYFVINSLRATLAFNVAVLGSTSTFTYNYRSSAQTVQFLSTTTSQISVIGNTATFSGQGKLNGQTGYSFTVTAKDGGAAGSGQDTAIVTITGPNNYSYSVNAAIAGGDIAIH